MRWLRYEADGREAYGIIEGDDVVEVKGDPFAGHERTATRRKLNAVKFLVPVIPKTFYAAGLNYRAHIEWANSRGGNYKVPEQADIGYRSNNALIGSGHDIVIPADSSGPVEYEGELVAVIGREAKNVSEARALDYVRGYTLGNDVSERSWQKSDRTLWRAKNADTFKPMGPWIVTDADLGAMVTTIRINGRVTETFKTNNMIFDAPTYISEVSKYCTIEPGDVMWMGTDGIPENMKPGDVCEIEISGIGVLRNKVVAE
jgi:2-keto-4-pentenoate hydratase/2-oxohepta-3-ene-1,7-dioic acid hydratase in catechol pathway